MRLPPQRSLRPLEHRPGRPNLRLSNGSGALDVDNHAVGGVDQISGGVGEESMPLVRPGPLGCPIRSGNELRGDGRGRAERRGVECGEIFARGANRVLLDLLRLPLAAWNRALLVRVRSDKTRVDRKSVGGDQTLRQAPLNDGLEKGRSMSLWRKRPGLFF